MGHFGRSGDRKRAIDMSITELLKLLQWNLENNYVLRGDDLLQQLIGIGMGIHTAPAEACALGAVKERNFLRGE